MFLECQNTGHVSIYLTGNQQKCVLEDAAVFSGEADIQLDKAKELALIQVSINITFNQSTIIFEIMQYSMYLLIHEYSPEGNILSPF